MRQVFEISDLTYVGGAEISQIWAYGSEAPSALTLITRCVIRATMNVHSRSPLKSVIFCLFLQMIGLPTALGSRSHCWLPLIRSGEKVRLTVVDSRRSERSRTELITGIIVRIDHEKKQLTIQTSSQLREVREDLIVSLVSLSQKKLITEKFDPVLSSLNFDRYGHTRRPILRQSTIEIQTELLAGSRMETSADHRGFYPGGSFFNLMSATGQMISFDHVEINPQSKQRIYLGRSNTDQIFLAIWSPGNGQLQYRVEASIEVAELRQDSTVYQHARETMDRNLRRSFLINGWDSFHVSDLTFSSIIFREKELAASPIIEVRN